VPIGPILFFLIAGCVLRDGEAFCVSTAHLKKDAQLGDIPIQDIKKESPNMANKDVLATHKKWEDPGGGGDDRR